MRNKVQARRDDGEGIGRGERIRTSGLYVPNVALYQAKLHPEALLRIFLVAAKSVATIDRESGQL